MQFGYKMSTKKLLFTIPAALATALIIYISWQFMFNFVPSEFKQYNWHRVVIEMVFSYFSIMTLITIVVCLGSDPGYIDPKYKHPLTNQGYAPLN